MSVYRRNLFTTLLIVLVSVVCTSCSIHGTLQGLYSYYNKTKAQSPDLLVHTANNPIGEIRNGDTAKVYIINGLQLKQSIQNLDNAVVYLWSPKCSSKLCYPLDLLQQACKRKNMDLFIVAEYYDSGLMEVHYKIDHPVFGIDTRYYKTNLTSKYLPRFVQELASLDDRNGRLLRFKKGVLVGNYNNLDEL